MKILLNVISVACLAFSLIGFVELFLGLFNTKAYNLLRAIVYCILFGIGVALLK